MFTKVVAKTSPKVQKMAILETRDILHKILLGATFLKIEDKQNVCIEGILKVVEVFKIFCFIQVLNFVFVLTASKSGGQLSNE